MSELSRSLKILQNKSGRNSRILVYFFSSNVVPKTLNLIASHLHAPRSTHQRECGVALPCVGGNSTVTLIDAPVGAVGAGQTGRGGTRRAAGFSRGGGHGRSLNQDTPTDFLTDEQGTF
jgi:hypothetical protein